MGEEEEGSPGAAKVSVSLWWSKMEGDERRRKGRGKTENEPSRTLKYGAQAIKQTWGKTRVGVGWGRGVS